MKNRRADDERLNTMGVRVIGLEGRVESIEKEVLENTLELKANTRLTRQVHEALYGREGDDGDLGALAKVKDVHDVLTDARRIVQLANKGLDGISTLAKPVAYVAGFTAALGIYLKTGQWKWPPW